MRLPTRPSAPQPPGEAEPGLQGRCRTPREGSRTGRRHTGRGPQPRRPDPAPRALPGMSEREGKGAPAPPHSALPTDPRRPRPPRARRAPGQAQPWRRGPEAAPGGVRGRLGPSAGHRGARPRPAAGRGGLCPSPPPPHSPAAAAEPEVRALRSAGADTQPRGCAPLRPHAPPSGPGRPRRRQHGRGWVASARRSARPATAATPPVPPPPPRGAARSPARPGPALPLPL